MSSLEVVVERATVLSQSAADALPSTARSNGENAERPVTDLPFCSLYDQPDQLTAAGVDYRKNDRKEKVTDQHRASPSLPELAASLSVA